MSVNENNPITIKIKNYEDLILDFRNVYLFIIAISSTAAYVYYQYSLLVYGENDWGYKPFELIYPHVGIYAVIDGLLCSTYEIILNHLIILCIFIFNHANDLNLEHRFLLSYPLLKTEISSVFLILKYWLPENTLIYHINSALFYLTFIKYRIYDYYVDLLYHDTVLDVICKDHHYSYLLYLSIYGLYILNLYWVSILTKILYKMITRIVPINTDILCHSICRYLHWINIPLSITIYHSQEKYRYDLIGLGMVSLSSYVYHQDIYHRLYLKKIDEYSLPTKENIVLFIGYTGSIQLRSFLALVTNYYDSPSFFSMVGLSGTIHLFSILQLPMQHKLEKIMNDTHFLLNNRMFLLQVPIVFDGLLIGLHSTNEIAIPLFFVNIMILLLGSIKPFYKLTPVSLGVAFIVQTYYISLSNLAIPTVGLEEITV